MMKTLKRKAGDDDLWNDGGSWWWRGPLIGKGSFGSVHLATPKKTRKTHSPFLMAVKSAEDSSLISLLSEKLVLNSLRGCPFVIQCFGEDFTTNQNGGVVYNVFMEFASGGTLGELIKKSHCGRLPENEVRYYTRSILQGVRLIHQKDFVHCDLKPDNILLVPSNTGFEPKIADFGLAKRANQTSMTSARGTPMFLSPEAVIDGVQEPPSDIWALGCVVLMMLTGNVPWKMKPGSNKRDLLLRIGAGNELPHVPSEISELAKDFLSCCFVRNPLDRMTAEMLMNHPFIMGLVEGGGCITESDDVLIEVNTPSSSPRDCSSFIPLVSASLSSSVEASCTSPRIHPAFITSALASSRQKRPNFAIPIL